jgi:hypothetical protein
MGFVQDIKRAFQNMKKEWGGGSKWQLYLLQVPNKIIFSE